MNKKTIFYSTAILLFSLTACNNQQESANETPKDRQVATEITKAPPKSAMEKGQSSRNETITGKVLETMNTSGYTYMSIDVNGKQAWVAIPESQVSVGDQVSVMPGMVMPSYHSKTLDRTFENIIFSGGLAKNGTTSPHDGGMAAPVAVSRDAAGDSFADAINKESGQQTIQGGQTSSGSTGAVAPFSEIKVEKAEGENGYTVEEIFGKAADLNGKTVRIKGKVVKFSTGIMGRNWIHLQDGTGDPMKNSHDLVVTSNIVANNDDIITVEGVVSADRDFGAGYRYDAIVEDAKIIE